MESPRRLRWCECPRRLRGGGDVSDQSGDVITSAETSRVHGGDVSGDLVETSLSDANILAMTSLSDLWRRRLRHGRRRLL